MELQVGLYEFFAYTLSGVAYSIAALLFMAARSPRTAIGLIHGRSTLEALGAAIVCYVAGLLLDPLARVLFRLVYTRTSREVSLQALRTEVPSAVVFENVYWPLLLAELHIEREAMVSHADRYKAASTFLRNAALAFSAGSLSTLTLWVRSGAGYRPIALAFGLAAAAVLALVESRKFDCWFHASICERLLVIRARKSQPSEFPSVALVESVDEP